jgi:hypothetical protein
MERSKPNVFVININPDNWEECLKDHRFGIRVDARHPKFNKGDIFLVRRTGKDYGVMGIWLFKEEKYVTTQDEVPWEDSDYRWQQWFDPIVDFNTPMSEEFTGKTKFSTKIQMAAARLIGSVAIIYEPEIARYLEAVLKEKAEECSAMVVYQGQTRKISDILQEILGYYRKKQAKPEPPPEKAKRGIIAGEVINFRGMVYAPLNEAGVVLLFSKVMDDLGVIYESSPTKGFDMVGRVRTKLGLELKHFEFEYQSSNFKTHGHDSSLVDYLVCWEHNWKGCPKDLEVWELREIIKDLPAEFPKELESD